MSRAPAFLQSPDPGLVADLVRFAAMAWPRVHAQDVRSIALLSSVSGEGTTTIACLLGQVLAAHQGLRVLLLDGNTRHPTLAGVADVDDSRGWREAATDVQTVCAPTRWPNVVVSPLGPAPPAGAPTDPAALQGLLDRCVDKFDVTLLDCAPLEFMGDALQIARLADAAILVVEAERLNRAALAHSCATLESLDLHFLGVLLNRHRHPVPGFLYRRA